MELFRGNGGGHRGIDSHWRTLTGNSDGYTGCKLQSLSVYSYDTPMLVTCVVCITHDERLQQ